MKKQLLAASLLSAAIAAQGSNTFGILFCQARVVDSGTAELAVELPATPGYVDNNGNPVAVWKVGTVAAGGAIDTFYSENGPGAFQVRNTGNRNAFIYITTGDVSNYGDSTDRGNDYYQNTLGGLFGGPPNFVAPIPDPSKRFSGNWHGYYSLAVSTAVTGKVPVWRNLEWEYDGSKSYTDYNGEYYGEVQLSWHNCRGSDDQDAPICGQYLCYLAAGEVQPFDLKFYAPVSYGLDYYDCPFIVRLEASTFRRWEHDK